MFEDYSGTVKEGGAERDYVNSWIFLKAHKIKSILCWHAQVVLILACLVLEKNQYEVFAQVFENTY